MLQEDRPRRATNPDRLKKYFDKANWSHATVRPGTCVTPALVGSWNGVPYDPRPFSRFNTDPRVTEPMPRYLVDNILYTPSDVKQFTTLKTEEDHVMETAQRTRKIGENQVPLMQKDQTYENYENKPALVEYKTTPKSLSLPEGVMTPAERRERLEFEVKHKQALRLEQKARQDRTRQNLLLLNQYPYGALGMDGPCYPDTVLYRGLVEKRNNTLSRDLKTSQERRQQITHSSCARERLGYTVIEHGLTSDGTENPRRVKPMGAMDTHERLFSATSLDWNPKRAQHLRNEEQGGRPYNIINGATVEHFPPSIKERTGNLRQAHPSISIHGYCGR